MLNTHKRFTGKRTFSHFSIYY